MNSCVPGVECQQWPEEGTRSLESGIQRLKATMKCSEFILGTLQENSVFIHLIEPELNLHTANNITSFSPRLEKLHVLCTSHGLYPWRCHWAPCFVPLMFCRQFCNHHWWKSTSFIDWVLWYNRFWLLENPPHWHPSRLENFPLPPVYEYNIAFW